jgi:hypothetical protein
MLCNVCGEDKPKSKFYKHYHKCKTGTCILCFREKQNKTYNRASTPPMSHEDIRDWNRQHPFDKAILRGMVYSLRNMRMNSPEGRASKLF